MHKLVPRPPTASFRLDQLPHARLLPPGPAHRCERSCRGAPSSGSFLGLPLSFMTLMFLKWTGYFQVLLIDGSTGSS